MGKEGKEGGKIKLSFHDVYQLLMCSSVVPNFEPVKSRWQEAIRLIFIVRQAYCVSAIPQMCSLVCQKALHNPFSEHFS